MVVPGVYQSHLGGVPAYVSFYRFHNSGSVCTFIVMISRSFGEICRKRDAEIYYFTQDTKCEFIHIST